jgi:hypothetical protein
LPHLATFNQWKEILDDERSFFRGQPGQQKFHKFFILFCNLNSSKDPDPHGMGPLFSPLNPDPLGEVNSYPHSEFHPVKMEIV